MSRMPWLLAHLSPCEKKTYWRVIMIHIRTKIVILVRAIALLVSKPKTILYSGTNIPPAARNTQKLL